MQAIPRRDIKPLAKSLIADFGSYAEVISPPPKRLLEFSGVGENVITTLKLAEANGANAHSRQSDGKACSKQLASTD